MAGSDNRMSGTYALLKSEGRNVSRIVTPEAINNEFKKSFSGFLVLPIPYKTASGYIKGTDILPEELLSDLSEHCHVILGSADSEITELSQKYGFSFTDINADEVFKMKNAVPTAEAAISTAINSTSKTLFSSNILIAGFGATGKALARLLVHFGAHVTIAARSKKDRALADLLGCRSIPIDSLKEAAKDSDVIFNTVPALIFTADVLSQLKKKAVLIDLASRPGGCDFEYSASNGINCRLYPALPDQYSPLTSVSVFHDTIIKIIDAV